MRQQHASAAGATAAAEEEEECGSPAPRSSALLGPNGERPSDDAIEAVHHDGRSFNDDSLLPPRHGYEYTADAATHYGFESFDPPSYVRDDGTVADDDKAAHAIASTFATERAARARAKQVGGAFLRSDGSRVDTVGDGVADDEEDVGPDLQPSHDDRVERGQTKSGEGLGFLRTPACQARASAPDHVTCFQCGQQPGWDLQMPSDVFETAWRAHTVGWGAAAVEAIVTMARLLRQMRDAEVVARCCVCNNVDCLLRAGLMLPEWRVEWLDGQRRPQDERETARKDQVALLERNVRLFHDLVKGGKLALDDVQHLMRFVVMNSQFAQEREKKFIATAMAVAENEAVFGYRFADPQRFVNRMASFIHGYAMNVLVPHIVDSRMPDAAWEAHLQKLVDTAQPKAPDAIFALMVESNAEHGNNFEREPAQPLHDGFDPERDELPFGR